MPSYVSLETLPSREKNYEVLISQLRYVFFNLNTKERADINEQCIDLAAEVLYEYVFLTLIKKELMLTSIKSVCVSRDEGVSMHSCLMSCRAIVAYVCTRIYDRSTL